MKHLMIDLETLSTRNDAAILTIGAVFFDIKTGELGDEFYCGVLPENNESYGHIDPNTVMFWLSQSQEAQNAIGQKTRDGIPLINALDALKNFCYSCTNPAILKIWSNGSIFDIVILENAFQRFNMAPPWNHWRIRDVRTIVELGRDLIGYDPKHDNPFDGVQHSALDDAIHQAKYVSDIYRALQSCMIEPDL